MKDIIIYAGKSVRESEFAEMLLLEFCERNCTAAVSASLNAEVSYIAVISTDSFSSKSCNDFIDKLSSVGISPILYGKEFPENLSPTLPFFERPFDVKKFSDYIAQTVLIKKSVIPYESERSGEGVTVDTAKQAVFCRGKPIELTNREYRLIEYLFLNRGSPVSREEAMRKVWGFGFTGDTNVVDVYIRYLRRKLDERFDSKFIITVRGKGYMLR